MSAVWSAFVAGALVTFYIFAAWQSIRVIREDLEWHRFVKRQPKPPRAVLRRDRRNRADLRKALDR